MQLSTGPNSPYWSTLSRLDPADAAVAAAAGGAERLGAGSTMVAPNFCTSRIASERSAVPSGNSR